MLVPLLTLLFLPPFTQSRFHNVDYFKINDLLKTGLVSSHLFVFTFLPLLLGTQTMMQTPHHFTPRHCPCPSSEDWPLPGCSLEVQPSPRWPFTSPSLSWIRSPCSALLPPAQHLSILHSPSCVVHTVFAHTPVSSSPRTRWPGISPSHS